jgi:hypothetical protein
MNSSTGHEHLLYCTEAGFLDETQTKVFKVFLLVIHSHLSAVQTCINRYTVQTHRRARYVQQSRLEDANIPEMFFSKNCLLFSIVEEKI